MSAKACHWLYSLRDSQGKTLEWSGTASSSLVPCECISLALRGFSSHVPQHPCDFAHAGSSAWNTCPSLCIWWKLPRALELHSRELTRSKPHVKGAGTPLTSPSPHMSHLHLHTCSLNHLIRVSLVISWTAREKSSFLASVLRLDLWYKGSTW